MRGEVRGEIIGSGDYPSQRYPGLPFRPQLKEHPLRFQSLYDSLQSSLADCTAGGLKELKVYDRIPRDVVVRKLC